MPQLEEVLYYLRGLWLALTKPEEGLRHLDFSYRGLVRSIWSILYCLPPILMSWAAYRMDYLSIRPSTASTGPEFFLKLAFVEIVVWIVPVVAMTGVLVAAGFSSRIVPVLVTYNWLMVPVSWALSVYSFLMILSPGDGQSFALIYLMLAVLSLAAEFVILSPILERNRLLVSAMLLANIVITFYISFKMQIGLGLVTL